MADAILNLHSFTVTNSKLSPTGITLYAISYSTSRAGQDQDVDQSEDGKEVVWRRYSELRDLYKALSKSYPEVKLSALPKGSYLDRFKQEVIESRRHNIHQLLNDISQSNTLLSSKDFVYFLTRTRRSTLSSFGIEKFAPKIRNATISAANFNPLFSDLSGDILGKRKNTMPPTTMPPKIIPPTTSWLNQNMQESCVQEYDSSTDAPSAEISASFSSCEKELQDSNHSSQPLESYTSPYHSMSYGNDSEGDIDQIGTSHEELIRSIGSGSDESYQAELEYDSVNPLLLDPLLLPMNSSECPDEDTGKVDSNYDTIHAKPSADMDILMMQDPLIQYTSNEPVNNDSSSSIDFSVLNIEDKTGNGEVSCEPEWWENAANETEDALKELEQRTKRLSNSAKSSPIHSVYETLPLDSVNQTMDSDPMPNPVNISNSNTNPMDGFEGVTRGGEMYSSGIELCKQGKLEEGLTQLENGIELFFCASRNVNLDSNYRKKLRSSLKKYLTYAEQVKTQLNEVNIQKSSKFPSEHSENRQIFKTPITLDELKVIEIVKNSLMLVQSSRTTDPMQKAFLIKTIQKNKINFVDPRHRHIKMSRNSLPSSPHLNIVQLLGSVQSSHLIYLMLEYVTGGNLAQVSAKHCRGDFLQNNGENFIRWTSQLISTLEELHLFGIFYLHLCPWDVLIREEDNSVKLSYPVRWEDTPDRLQEGKNMPYIAPECIHPITPVYSESADWWSLGAICYELVTGRNLMATHGEGFREGKSIYFPQHCFFQSTLDKDQTISLITQLLTFNYTERMQFVNEIKQHPIFKNVDWSKLRTSKFNMQTSQESHF